MNADINKIVKEFDDLYMPKLLDDNIYCAGSSGYMFATGSFGRHVREFLTSALIKAKEQGRREGVEEIKQYLEKVYVEKWNDADHCSCLPYTIHELFCPHCTDENPVAFCKYPDNPTEE